MYNRIIQFVLGLAFLALSTCHPDRTTPELHPAFYHWKQQYSPSPNSLKYLDSLGVNRLYLRCFDVGWDARKDEPVPLSIIEIDSISLNPEMEVVPVVFLTEECMARVSTEGLEQLANDMLQLLGSLLPASSEVVEYQFDCDWADRSREAYFSLLETLGERLPVPISATLRLHQLRYPERTGLPPADRAVVMYYNMGEVEAEKENNSIFNPEIGSQYLDPAKAYPLALDLALPLFQWGVVFREGSLVSLINELSEQDLKDTTRFISLDESRFEVRKSTYIKGYYLYAGDQIRLEGVTQDALLKVADQWVNRPDLLQKGHLIFYHLDEPIRKRFPHEVLHPVLQAFLPAAPE